MPNPIPLVPPVTKATFCSIERLKYSVKGFYNDMRKWTNAEIAQTGTEPKPRKCVSDQCIYCSPNGTAVLDRNSMTNQLWSHYHTHLKSFRMATLGNL